LPAARGADTLAEEWAKVRGIPCTADWDDLGRKAGPIRNAQMLRKGRPELVVACPGRRQEPSPQKRTKKRSKKRTQSDVVLADFRNRG
jgi:hypothetical protein